MTAKVKYTDDYGTWEIELPWDAVKTFIHYQQDNGFRYAEIIRSDGKKFKTRNSWVVEE